MIIRKPSVIGTAAIGAALAMLTLPVAAAAPSATAPAWTVDKAASTLGFSGVGNGEAFSGSFGKWDAKINFDPAHLEQSMAEVTIETGSANTGDPSRDDPLSSAEWFSTAAFPTASFTTESITSVGPTSYDAKGELTIKGVSIPVTLPFTLKIEGDTATMQGSVTIDRSQWGVGAGSWQDKSVDPNVKVMVKLTAKRGG